MKTIQELYLSADTLVAEAFRQGQDDTYRWFIDRLCKEGANKDLITILMTKFVEERHFPERPIRCSQCGEIKSCKTKDFGHGLVLPCCSDCVSE